MENQEGPNTITVIQRDGETLEEFIKRVQPSSIYENASFHIVNPKIYGEIQSSSSDEDETCLVENPTSDNIQPEDTEDEHALFMKAGTELLNNFQEAKKNGRNPEINVLRNQLLRCAKKYSIISGKWLLFIDNRSEIDDIWRKICESVVADKLGRCATLFIEPAEPPNEKDTFIICVHNDDFTNYNQVKGNLYHLESIGADPFNKKCVYKCDAYSYLNIFAKNPYNLRPSIFDSNMFRT